MTTSNNAFVTIHSDDKTDTATESARLVFEMYLRWARQNGFGFSIVETSSTPKGGIRTATLYIRGAQVYQRLKSETGVHELAYIDQSTKVRVLVFCELTDPEAFQIANRDIAIHSYHYESKATLIEMYHFPSGIKVCNQVGATREERVAFAKLQLRSLLCEKHAAEQLMLPTVPMKNWVSPIRHYSIFQGFVEDFRSRLRIPNLKEVLGGHFETVCL